MINENYVLERLKNLRILRKFYYNKLAKNLNENDRQTYRRLHDETNARISEIELLLMELGL